MLRILRLSQEGLGIYSAVIVHTEGAVARRGGHLEQGGGVI